MQPPSYHLEQAEHRQVNYYKEAHEHLNRARRIFVSLKDRVCLAQCDETRARVFLKEKRYAEAEKAARASVRSLENSDRPSLLAEALKRHGTALARLGSHGAALTAFRRAIDLCLGVDCPNRAADTLLTLYEELGERLTIGGPIATSGKPLDEEVFLLEHDLIKRALEDAQGRITFAARTLGMSYQRLTHKLKTEHKDLLQKRTPVRRRPRKQESR